MDRSKLPPGGRARAFEALILIGVFDMQPNGTHDRYTAAQIVSIRYTNKNARSTAGVPVAAICGTSYFNKPAWAVRSGFEAIVDVAKNDRDRGTGCQNT